MQKLTLILAGAALAVAHGPMGDKPAAKSGAKVAGYVAAPAGVKCKTMPGDAAWPTKEEWTKAFPGVIARGARTASSSPDYRLEVTTVQQVIDAVNFARKNNIRLSMITSGHDGLGRNNAASGLLLGMENLKGLRVEDSFTPTEKGMPPVDNPIKTVAPPKAAPMAGMAGMSMKRALPVAVTFGAGMSTQQINDKIADKGIFTNGAEHGEVGVAGGWAQCGGHGPMSSAYGLGADQVLEFQVVTPDGQLKIANEKSNPDLYWALRGGCGSTYGVVVQATVRAYPSTKFNVAKFYLQANNNDAIYDPAAYMHTKFVELNKKGVQGYYLVFPNFIQGYFHTVGRLANKEFNSQLWDPIIEKMKSFPGMNATASSLQYLDYGSYKAYYDSTWGPAEDDDADRKKVKRTNWWWGERAEEKMSLMKRHGPGEGKADAKAMPKDKGSSRLLGETELSAPGLAAAMKAGMPSGPGAMLRGGLIGGMGVQAVAPDATSVHPAWRKAYVSLWVGGNSAPLDDLAKNMGVYVNEGSYNETNWKEAFWGSNYPRLSKIKAEIDPDYVLYVTPGINADHMTSDSYGRLCMAADASAQGQMYPPVGDNRNYA